MEPETDRESPCETLYETHRAIITKTYEDGVHRYTGEQPIPSDGDVHQVWTVASPAAQARADRAALDRAIESVRPFISRKQYVALSDGANTLDTSIRLEAISRMVAAAQGMIDFPIAVFLMAPQDTSEEAE